MITTRWVTFPRTDADMDRINEMRCSCGTGVPNLDMWHAHGEVAFFRNDAQTAFGSASLFLLYTALMDLKGLHEQEEKNARAFHKKRKHDSWPRRPQDVLPHGLEDTVRGLIAWFYLDLPTPVHVNIYHGLLVLSDLFQLSVVPYVATSSLFLEELYIRHVATAVQRAVPPGAQKKDHRERYMAALNILSPIARLAHNLVGRGMDEVQRWSFVGTDPRFLAATGIAIDLCFRIVCFFETAGDTKTEYEARTVARDLQHVGAAVYDITPQVHTLHTQISISDFALSGFQLAHQNYMKSPRDRLLRTLYRLSICRTCMAPGCTNAVFGGRGRGCAGCLRVPYCSRQCQRRAWSHKAAPHRSVCASIRQLCLHLCLPRDGRALSEEMNEQEKRLSANGPWEGMALAVVEHFLDITRYEARIHCELASSIGMQNTDSCCSLHV
jgi:hypothetical protein